MLYRHKHRDALGFIVGSLHLEFVCFFLVLCIELYCIARFYTIFICK